MHIHIFIEISIKHKYICINLSLFLSCEITRPGAEATTIRRLEGIGSFVVRYSRRDISLSEDQPEGYLNRLGLNSPELLPTGTLMVQRAKDRRGEDEL